MIRLPLNRSTLPALAVEIDGQAIFGAARHLIAGEPLGDQMLQGGLRVIDVRFDLSDGTHIPLGSVANVVIQAEADARLTYVDNDERFDPPDILARYAVPQPDADQFLLILESAGEAKIGVAADFPAGAFTFGLTAGAGGKVGFVHIRPFERRTTAGEAFEDFLKSTRLPHDITDPADLPVEGEVLAFEYGGYLSIGLSAGWGYSVSTYAGAEFGEMGLKSNIDITSAIQLRGGVEVAGDFALEVRRGHSDGWARVIVRKRRERAFTFSGGLNIGIDITTEGVPQDADQFLEVALGLKAPQIVEDLRELLAQGDAEFLAHLRERKDALLEKFVEELSERWLERALTSDILAPLFERLQDVIRLYDDLDDMAVATLEGIVETKSKGGRRLDEIVDEIDDAFTSIVESVDLDVLKAVDNPVVWDFLRRYVGTGWVEFLTTENRFEEVRQAIATIRESQWKRLVEFVHIRYESLGLTSVVKRLRDLIDVMRSVDDPEEAVRQAEKHLLAAAERITDRAFDAMAGPELRQAISDLAAVLDEIDAFKGRIYADFKGAINRSHKLAVARTLARTKESDALMDVEIHLGADRGRALMRRAVRGRFDNLLDDENLSVIRIHEAAFSHRLETHNQLKVDLFGWNRSSFRRLILETKKTVRHEGDGLLHVYALSSDEEVTRKGRGEEIKLNFLLNLQAAGSRADVVDSVDRMSAQYTVGVEDRRTSEKELIRYLSLARELGILPMPPETIIATLREELDKQPGDRDWGTVSLKYEARWQRDGLRRLVEIPINQMLFSARETLATIVGGAFLSFYREGEEHSLIGRGSMWHYRVGRLLLDRGARDSLRRKGRSFYRSDESYCRILDGEELCIGGSSDPVSKTPFLTFFTAEKEIERALVQIRSAVEANATRFEDLEDAFALLARQRKRLADAMPREVRDRLTDPFFAILDRLVTLVAGPDASLSVLELTLHHVEDGRDAAITKIYA